MRVAVVNNWAPFLRGGAEFLADALVSKLQAYGHEAVLVRLPFRWDSPEKIAEQILACRCLRLHNVDRVIALKFPAYFIPHDNKVVWLLHQFRQAYDLWGTPLQDLPDSSMGRRIREIVVQSDNTYLPECRAIYTNSHVTGDRLRKFNNLDSSVLYPPLFDPARFITEGYGDFIFVPGRITAAKRQYLAVEAMRYVRSSVRMVVAGPPETAADRTRLEELVARYALGDRVALIARFISDQEQASYYAKCLACAYLPHDEDSYGYVTLEAAQSAKATLTCTDSGGITILVLDSRTGLVAQPDPQALAGAFDRLYENRAEAQRMGEAAREHMRSLRIEWDHVIERLTA
jgi:glycosyltransferase involved in cell wall biosynthesis